MGLPPSRGWSTMVPVPNPRRHQKRTYASIPSARHLRGILMIGKNCLPAIGFMAALAFLPPSADAKDKVKVAFIDPLTGGTAANGIGGRNSAELAVKLRNADPKAKYE